ncbi:MAG: uracil-DNA glycosylase [Gemmatimonadaceae bacterium]
MDARARLRAYLEQRRELGEGEFVLDGLSVDDAMSAIDALRTRPAPMRAQVREARPDAALAAPPAAPAQAPPAQVPANPEPAAPEDADQKTAPDVRLPESAEGAHDMNALEQGLVVGTPNGTLFERNPFADVRSLAALAKLVQECTRCPLYQTAINGVPGEGDPKAGLMVVGEAPGANEDETGRPFVGQSGALLTKILEAIDLKREDVFISNVVKHRPPGNRNPTTDEVAACSPYLVRQIQIIKPKVILALGTFAAQTLLNTKTPIGKLRGAVHRYHGTPLIVTYHPAALLRNPAWKRPTWEDVKLARSVLDSTKS